MKSLRVSLGLALLLLVGSAIVRHNPRSALSQTQGGSSTVACCGPSYPEGPRELDFAYYSLRDGFDSQLQLVSDSPKPIDLTIAVRDLAGETMLTSATIGPQAKLAFDLRALITELGADPMGSFAEGSVAVCFFGTIMPVAGQITMTNANARLVHESEMVENDPGRTDIPPILNGLWWNLGGGRDARIMVSNTSAFAVAADVYLDFLGSRQPSAPLSFRPHETKVLSVTQLLGALSASPAQAPQGGITILQRGGVPKLIAQGKVFDPVTGFSTTLRFPSPESQPTSTLHGSGLPISTPSKGSPFAGMGTFVPHVVARNLLPTPQTVTIELEYPTKVDSGGHSNPSSQQGTSSTASLEAYAATATGRVVLPPLTVGPYATQDLALDSAIGELPLPLPYCSVRIRYSGPPASLMAELASVEQQKDLVVDSKLQDEGWGWAGSGANPWHLDDETESVLFLTNMGDELAPIGFEVTANDVHYYLTELTLQPHETRAVDLRKLRDAQQPDLERHVIPATATDGSVNWIRLVNVPVMGRLVVIQRHGGVASNYDCNTCPCPATPNSVSVSPSNASIVVTGTQSFGATVVFIDCNGNLLSHGGPVTVTWSSSPTSVATMSGSTATGQGGGTATITADAHGCSNYSDDGKCTCTNQGDVYGKASLTVLYPASLSIVAGTDSTTKEATCSAGSGTGCGVTRTFTYQVLDQNSNPITGSWIATQQFWDEIHVTSPDGLGLKSSNPKTTCSPPNTGPCGIYVNSLGQFNEAGLGACSTACYVNKTCATAGYTAASQTWHVGSYPIVNSVSVYCDHVLWNGH
jgi:hypothetical protein